MKLEQKVKQGIRESQLFLFIAPREGDPNLQEMIEQLKYAMLLKKHILFWFPHGRELLPKPKEAEGYADFSIVVGDAEKVADKIQAIFPNAKELGIFDGGVG